MLILDVATIEHIYANFSATMVPIFRDGARGVRRKLFKLKYRSRKPISFYFFT